MFGRCKIKAVVKTADKQIEDIGDMPSLERYIDLFDGVVDFFFSMSELLAISGAESLDQLEVYVEAQVEDPYFGDLSNGSFITTLYDPKIQLKFLGKQPRSFKPNMPFTTYIVAYNQDGTQVKRNNASIRICVEIDGSTSNQVYSRLGSESIVSYTFIPESNTRFFTISATYVENDDEDATTKIYERAVRYRSPSESFIFVSSSTRNPQVGDYMIFTVKCTQPTDLVYYHIISAGRIVFSGTLAMNNKQKTFDVGLTREMSPSAHIVAYYIKYDGEFVADSYNFHVNSSSVQNKVNVTINRRKDFTGNTIEVLAYASPQSFVGFAALDYGIVKLYNGGNMITELTLYDELYSFDTFANVSFQHTWNVELGFAADRLFFPSESYAFDALRTFTYSGLMIFTDIPVYDSLALTSCNISLGQLPCLEGNQCYHINQRCNNICNCQNDCFDESGCPEQEIMIKPLYERFQPKIERIYQLSWLWKDAFTLPDGRVQYRAEVPKDIANYVITVFAVSRLSGFGVLKFPIHYEATRQFYIQVEMPEEVRLGEQIGIVVDVFNFQSQRIEGLVILHASEDYKFVNIEADGLVSSFAPRLSSRNHQVLVIIHPGQSRRINLPITPTKIGQIEVKIEALSGVSRDMFTQEMTVRYEGVTNTFQTPYLLSLVNMPRLISEFEINANQTFLLPLQQIWTFVPGSASCKISITGDVCGPFFFLGYDDEVISTDNMLKKSFAACESGIFSLGTMIYNLMYMRQGHGGKIFVLENVLKILDMANLEYVRMMCVYDKRGFFTQYGVDNTESVWLTSWALMVLKDAVDPIWEQYSLFIDPELLSRTIVWLIAQQNPINGSWTETGPVYDRKFTSNYTRDWNGDMIQLNISLTAQCVIALKANSDIRGNAAKLISNSINKGRLYLEQHLPKIKDAFELSIVTYALHVTNSPIKDIAFQRLNSTKLKNDYGVYWSNVEIPKMRTYWPSKNPRQNWKPESNNEGLAVAATAYALLTHLNRAEKYNKYEIMTWLQTQRNYLGGMSSTYDSLTAQKALVLYAIGTGDAIQNYDMNISFTSSSLNDLVTNYRTIDDSNIIEMQTYEVENVWGNVLVDGQGTGFALLQMTVTWNVEYPWQIRKPPYEAFNISLQTRLHGRNFSHIEYNVCLSWLPENYKILNANQSGHAQFEIQIPSGYKAEERYLKSLVGVVRNLGDGENAPGPQLNFLFDFLDLDPICFSFTIERYVPVANVSRYYEMRCYEYHEPGNANRSMYYLRDLFSLDICEVCGSYQCPYCPYYAFAFNSNKLNILILIACYSTIILIFIK